MSCDLLLEWMTHMGSGSWGAFRDAVDEISIPDKDRDEHTLYRSLRVAFSDLGHVDFFVNGSRRWRVRRPALAAFGDGTRHLLVGGRTRSLIDNLASTATNAGAAVTITESVPGLSYVHVEGDADRVRIAAESLGIDYLPHAAARLAARVPPVRQTIDFAKEASEPINWMMQSWSFDDAQWVPKRLDRTVREYRNRYGVRRYLLSLGRHRLLEIERRHAIYCAALVRGVRFVRYSHRDKALYVPRWAPLPEAYARAACLSGGALARVRGGDLVFEGIDARVASVLLVALGQGFPMHAVSP